MRWSYYGVAALICGLLLGASGAAWAREATRGAVRPPRLYDRADVSGLYFFPRRTGALARTATAQPIRLRLDDGTEIGAYWSRPLRGKPTLLYFAGNGETIADQLQRWPRWAQAAGANICFVDYPGYGTSGGRPSLSGCAAAAEKALQHLLAQPAAEVPSVVVMGRSAGSIFALHAAASSRDPRVRGLILESAVAEPRQRFEARMPAGFPDRQRILADIGRDFDHRRSLSRLGCPVMILHTVQDRLVPAANAQRLARWCGVEPVLFPQGDHNTIQQVNEPAYRDHLGRFLQQHTAQR